MKRLITIIGLILLASFVALPTTAQTCGTAVATQAGDTLWDIGQRCNVTVPALLDFNLNITEPSLIDPGITLAIPSEEQARQPQVSVYPQSVRPGDRIQVIANGFPLTVDVLITVGQDAAVPVITQTAKTDRQGALTTTVAIPPTADLDERWVVVIETTEETYYAAHSFAFFIDEETERVPVVQPTLPPGNLFTETQIYLVALETGGSVGCGDSTTPFTVSIEPTIAPLTAALNQLLSLPEFTFGYYNALGQSDLSVRGIDIDESTATATIDLIGELVVSGTCDMPRLEAQLRQTALQFSTIEAVNILLNEQPLTDLISPQ